MSHEDLQTVGREFALGGAFQSAERYGSGHINDTYKVVYETEEGPVSYLHQRINQEIFPQPHLVMENIDRVTAHLQASFAAKGVTDLDRRCLRVIPTGEGENLYLAPDGAAWRTYHFVAGGATYDVVASPAMAEEAARAFGQFQAMLLDLPGPRLHETIPNFHHTPSRLAQFEAVVGEDPMGRKEGCEEAVSWAMDNREFAEKLWGPWEAGAIPERVTHNDTKLNNVLLDEVTGEALCVIDLETVMPGLSLYDFGDLVRTASHRCAEDEQDPSGVKVDPELFAGLARGYLDAAGSFLNETERGLLLESGIVITYETGLRFLGDHLSGDQYFRIHREGQNLDRARTQFALVESLSGQAETLIGDTQ